MATTQEYLSQLQADKQTLVNNLTTKGVSASNDETFTSLVPKVLDIEGGSDIVITDYSYLFYHEVRLSQMDEILSISKNVTNCQSMFSYCQNLTALDISNFDTSKVTDMSSMFFYCQSLTTLDVSSLDTSKVTNMSYMFYHCEGLTTLDISNFDTSNVTNSSYMFNNCQNLETLIIDNPNMFKMTNKSMFSGTPIANGTGYVYVPDNMVETYKSAANWSTYADQIKGMSELPSEEV